MQPSFNISANTSALDWLYRSTFSGIPVQSEEIQPCELGRHVSELQVAVEAVCESASFRTSPKSCQFLRYIVHRTLQGNADELKERLIGMALLGREACYDTGSDAGVRVRANDVRKRLAAYYAASSSQLEFILDLPAGSYVPRFYKPRFSQSAEPAPEPPIEMEPPTAAPALPQVTRLSRQLLALPTLVALFLCVVCMRWQLTQEHPYVLFWNIVLQDHHALLYVPLSRPGEKQEVSPVERLEDTAPLFNLAGQFHAGITFSRTLTSPIGANDILILIGTIPTFSIDSTTGDAGLDRVARAEGNRLVIDTLPSGRQIVDRSTGNSPVTPYKRAALLTIANGAQRSIHIDGTDGDAIDSLINTMCDPNAFPEELIGSFQDGTVTQIVFPLAPHAQPLVFHESLPTTQIAMKVPQ
jgi:hypothetical protein